MGVLCSHLGSEQELVLLLEHLGQGHPLTGASPSTFPVSLLCCPVFILHRWVALPPLKVSLSCSSSTAGRSLGLSDGRSGLQRRSSKVRPQGQLPDGFARTRSCFLQLSLIKSYSKTAFFFSLSPRQKPRAQQPDTQRSEPVPVENTEPRPCPQALLDSLVQAQANSDTELQFVGSDHFLDLYF